VLGVQQDFAGIFTQKDKLHFKAFRGADLILVKQRRVTVSFYRTVLGGLNIVAGLANMSVS